MEQSLCGRDVYARKYAERLQFQATWLQLTAAEKVDSVQRLLHQLGISKAETILELGCGTGAVAAECMKRGLAGEYYAVDYAPEAIGYLKEQNLPVTPIHSDIFNTSAYATQKYQVVLLSHVLEHLEKPNELLRHLHQNLEFDYLLMEVPLENLFLGRVKSRFQDRSKHAAGHVQFFNALEAAQLLKDAGYERIALRRYSPTVSWECLRFRNKSKPVTFIKEALTANILPKLLDPLWKRCYYAHYAAVAKKV